MIICMTCTLLDDIALEKKKKLIDNETHEMAGELPITQVSLPTIH